MIQALRYGRYSGASTSSLDEDLKEIEAADQPAEAIEKMRQRIRAIEPFSAEEFLRDYSDSRFGRLLLYLLAFRNKAADWDPSGNQTAFQGTELVSGFSPQFHHIFPRGFLVDKQAAKPRAGITIEQVEALANIAIIGAGVNIRISDKGSARVCFKIWNHRPEACSAVYPGARGGDDRIGIPAVADEPCYCSCECRKCTRARSPNRQAVLPSPLLRRRVSAGFRV